MLSCTAVMPAPRRGDHLCIVGVASLSCIVWGDRRRHHAAAAAAAAVIAESGRLARHLAISAGSVLPAGSGAAWRGCGGCNSQDTVCAVDTLAGHNLQTGCLCVRGCLGPLAAPPQPRSACARAVPNRLGRRSGTFTVLHCGSMGRCRTGMAGGVCAWCGPAALLRGAAAGLRPGRQVCWW